MRKKFTIGKNNLLYNILKRPNAKYFNTPFLKNLHVGKFTKCINNLLYNILKKSNAKYSYITGKNGEVLIV